MPINNFREDEATKQVLKITTIKRLLSYMLNYRSDIVKVFGLMFVILGITVTNPILIKISIDHYIKNGDFQGLLVIGGIAVVINLISAFCIRKRIQIMGQVSNKILMEIRQELYEHIQKLSFNFFDHRPVGKILARVIGDVDSLKDVLNNSVITLLPDFATVIVVFIIMLVLHAPLALTALTLLPLLILGMWFVEVRAHKRWQVMRKKNANMNAFTHEAFSGIRVVQSFTAEEQTSKTFHMLLKDIKYWYMHAVKLNDMFWPMVELSWGFGTVLVFYLGVRLSDNGEITVGILVAFISYISMFWNPIMNLSNFYNQLITNIAGAERIFEILDIEPDLVDKNNAHWIGEIQGEVQFDKVSFAYEDENPVLKDVSFHVNKGETIALVGPTGGGKSTIVNLICRFYDIQSGQILVDGQDIKNVVVESLRSQMGIMTQDTFLFSGTVRENIRYGKLDASDEEVEVAARSVHAHGFIQKLENGYDTVINEKGSKLSVGQRQLIAFARTMIAEPKILILDEATSSIDTTTERLVQKGIESLLAGRTSFVIAHRLSTIQKADRILVIKDERITESGNHEQLLSEKGHYYDLYMAQFSAFK